MLTEKAKPDFEGLSDFAKWASLFSGKIFAMIVVYADETGTGGIPASGKEPAPGICGFLATSEMWEDFRVSWKTALDKSDAPYFHFRELNKTERLKSKNPFRSWSDDRVDDFIHEMAMVASTGPIPFGGNASVKRIHGGKPSKANLQEIYKIAFEQFFEDFGMQMRDHFPNEVGKVSFFFDDNNNEDWIAILNKTLKQARKLNPIIGDYTPIESKSERGIPCQAADLFAYVNRQNNETVYEKGFYVPHRILDIVLGRQGIPSWHPFRALKEMSDDQWKNLVAELRGRKKQFDLKHELAGTKPKPQYYPIIEHQYFNYLYVLCKEHQKTHKHLWDGL